jgi:hypothetical protein
MDDGTYVDSLSGGDRVSLMGDCGAPSTTIGVEGACEEFLRLQKKMTRIAAEIATTPPTTPPAMAPTLELGPGLGVWEGVGDLVEVAVLLDAVPELITEPGYISGVSGGA